MRWKCVRLLLLAVLGLYATWTAMLSVVAPAHAWTLHGIAIAVGLLSLTAKRRGLTLPLALLLTFWLVIAAMRPVWAGWNPDLPRVRFEASALAVCAALTLAVCLLAGPGRRGACAIRAAWVVVGATLMPFAVGEVITGRHVTFGGTYEPPGFSPAGPFGNPNNLACILVVLAGICFGRLSERISAVERAVLVAAAVVLIALTVLTLSRGALGGLLVVGLAAGVLALHRSRHRHWLRHRVRWWLAGVALIAGLAIPALRDRNPLAALIFPTDEEHRRSDSLRLTLVKIALQQWREQPWTGIGGARYEFVLADDHPEVGHVVPVHLTFVEILAEYGLLVALPLATLCVFLALTLLRSTPTAAGTYGRPRTLDRAGVRYLGFVFAVGYVLAGFVMSSALLFQPWWLLLASLIVCCAHLRGERARAAPPEACG